MSDASPTILPGQPIGGVTNLTLTGKIASCETVRLSWQGGLSPARIEFYEQQGSADWDSVPDSMRNVAYNMSGYLDWQVNAPAGRNIWVSIVDHNGFYSQNREPWVVQDGNEDCLTVDKPLHESGLTKMAVIFLSFLLLAVAIIFYLLYKLSRRKQLTPSLPLERPFIEEDTRSLPSQSGYSPYHISTDVMGQQHESPDASSPTDTIATGPFKQLHTSSGSAVDEQSPSTTTWHSQQPLLRHTYDIDMTEVRSPLSIQPSRAFSTSSRSSAADTISSHGETIETMATNNTSARQSSHNGDTASEADSSLHESATDTQFFPIRVPTGTATWKPKNPFLTVYR